MSNCRINIVQWRPILFFCFLCLLAPAFAADWPQFRGPTGQGHATARHLPKEWSSTKNVAWKAPIPGSGWSSPILQNDRLYMTTAVVDGASGRLSLRALSVNSASGKILWNKEVFTPEGGTGAVHKKNSQASPTPVVEGERLYVHFGHHGIACLDLNGNIIWRNPNLKYSPVHGNGGSPILVDNAVVYSADGGRDPFVVALDKADGSVLWKTSRITDADRTFSFSTPLLITVKGRPQVISPGSNAICAYDPKTGREIWRVRYEGYSVIPRPVHGQGLIFISTGYDHPMVMAIRPDGQGDVTATHVAWTIRKGAPNTPSLLLVGSELYMLADNGVASCVDAGTGKFHWNERLGGDCSASPVFADGRIYFQNEGGTGFVVEPGKTFAKLAQNSLGERTLASYAVGDGCLFIRSEQHLYKIQN